MKFSKNRLQDLLLKASFIGTFSETMIVPMWSILTARVGGTLLEAGIGYALFSIITGIVVITVGRTKWFSDNIKSMIFWGFLISGCGDVAYVFAQNVYQLVAVQCLVGISVGFLNPAWDGLYSGEVEEGKEGEQWSFWTGGVSFFVGVAGLLGTIIATYLGMVYVFVAMGIFDFIAVVIAYQVWRHKE